MDETPFGFGIFLFILYWIFVKDPQTPDDKRLDEQTRSNLLMFSGLALLYTLNKTYITGGEGLSDIKNIFIPTSDDHEILETAMGSETETIKNLM